MSRFVFCRGYIAEKLHNYYLEHRFDGSDRVLAIEDAEQIIADLNALSKGQTSNLNMRLSEDKTLRAVLRGLLSGEVFSKERAAKYCSYKFHLDIPINKTFPEFVDPDFVRDIDYFFGCEYRGK